MKEDFSEESRVSGMVSQLPAGGPGHPGRPSTWGGSRTPRRRTATGGRTHITAWKFTVSFIYLACSHLLPQAAFVTTGHPTDGDSSTRPFYTPPSPTTTDKLSLDSKNKHPLSPLISYLFIKTVSHRPGPRPGLICSLLWGTSKTQKPFHKLTRA